MNKHSGSILLLFMVLFFLLSLLLTSIMQTLLLSFQGLNEFIADEEALTELEFFVRTLMKNDSDGKTPCLIQEHNPNEMLTLVRKMGCVLSEAKQKTAYLIEDLGSFPCLQIRFSNQLIATKHRRISLINQDRGKFLQVRVAYPYSAGVNCKEQEKAIEIHVGILSWRYLRVHPA